MKYCKLVDVLTPALCCRVRIEDREKRENSVGGVPILPRPDVDIISPFRSFGFGGLSL